MSSALVTDQKPSSSGYSVIFAVQWTGQPRRSCLNVSCGGPSSHSSRSVTRRSSRGFASTDIGDLWFYSRGASVPKSLWVLTVRQIALSALVVLLLPSIAAAQTWVAPGVAVNDGDTIHVRRPCQVETRG